MVVVLAALVAALSVAGCARGIATGGGTIPSKFPETRGATTANFGFWGDSCGVSTTGNFNYHDKSVFNEQKAGGLKMVGPVQDACDCMQRGTSEDCDGLCAICDALSYLGDVLGENGYVSALKAHYYSSNPKLPGEGTAYACVVDNGEGSQVDADDALAVTVEGGPYDGYFNWGEVSGNLQAYPCPED
jgi:hypothetical protein